MKRTAIRPCQSGRLRVCAHCGEEFVAAKEFRSFKRKYCSHGCYSRALSARTRATYPPREEIERLYVGEGMTDRAIAARYGRSYTWVLNLRKHYGIAGRRKSDPRKPLHHRRDRARWGMHLKPEDSCRNCGAGGHLNLHHAIPRSMSRAAKYDLRNGLPLCAACHLDWHQRGLRIYRDVFTEEEWAFISSVELVGQDTTAWLDDRYPGRPEGQRVVVLEHERARELGL